MPFHKSKAKEPITVYDDNPYVIKCGKKVYWKEYTETAQREGDVEIYPTLKKYGLQTPDMLPEKMFDNQAFIGDLEEFGDLRQNLDRKVKAEQMWLNLPIKIREKFGHSIDNFIDGAPKFLEELKAVELAKQPKAPEQAEQIQTEGGKNNA